MNHLDDYLDGLACALAEERGNVEAELIGAILSEPARGICLALNAGVNAALFEQDDLRLMFVAAKASNGSKLDLLRVIRAALIRLGLWDETDHRFFSRCMRWGDESLWSLACDSFPGPLAVNSLARKLQWIDARQKQAGWHKGQMIGLLDGSIDPDVLSMRPTRRSFAAHSF